MSGLSCGEESMTILCSAVLIQCQRVTDRRTDVQAIAITCFSIADARKNNNNNNNNKNNTELTIVTVDWLRELRFFLKL